MSVGDTRLARQHLRPAVRHRVNLRKETVTQEISKAIITSSYQRRNGQRENLLGHAVGPAVGDGDVREGRVGNSSQKLNVQKRLNFFFRKTLNRFKIPIYLSISVGGLKGSDDVAKVGEGNVAPVAEELQVLPRGRAFGVKLNHGLSRLSVGDSVRPDVVHAIHVSRCREEETNSQSDPNFSRLVVVYRR